MFLYTFFTKPIKNIYIKNTSLLTDNEIIEVAGIKDYPSIFKLSKRSIEKKISSLELVQNVEVKKGFNGKLIINVTEAIPLFYNRNTQKVALSNDKQVDSTSKYLGIPTLINYVPSDLLNEFIDAFQMVDTDVINMINEIEYDPDIQVNENTGETIVIDNNRFLLRMNDTNYVYVNIINMKRLNDYKSVLMTVGDKRGILYLDSYDSSNDLVGLFTEFEDSSNNTGDSGEIDGEN